MSSSASAPQKTPWSYSRLGVPATHCNAHPSLSHRQYFSWNGVPCIGRPSSLRTPGNSRLLWASKSSSISTSSKSGNLGSALQPIQTSTSASSFSATPFEHLDT
ncbi:uncharacterized protein LACBIDRAFT_317384 [Laccaria bicolor S238N-H82]|uniref:Predicted protein n=1 Tax=Laccaria bicolor (strain S238N-H82 / ATCC MYA-4686) TaxID=486041 RepID=B0D528_LACBS|nr:uncharacterized protein LACBIDRAFT_317384 [Laccaria bicolor S238N-H82]EDR10449.1 predicted protein [Laccaria bicolor S238N-H82]|eukprot:XP_001878899.1 predicted protein [Laccaria bicolor S238N-H82]